ncbi:MAG: hypothetical protein PVJ57_00850 [Phycisphaerae bacterium]|jgi:hypothetical protein
MQARKTSWILVVGVLLLLPVMQTRAEVTSTTGAVSVTVHEYVNDQAGVSDTINLQYPSTGITLPVQAVVRLLYQGDDPAAAAVAAQLADPGELSLSNPEEFAVNLALLSISPDIRYTAQASSQETRGIIFTTEDFPGRQDGDTLTVIGRLYIDGALAVFSPVAARDLTGASVYLRVTVVQTTPTGSETVFSGRVGLEGAAAGAVSRVAEGDFPTTTLIRTNLASFVDDFEVFEVLIIPSLRIAYDYPVTIGEEFSLRATVEVEAANATDQVGVSAIVGTPVDSIQEVISAAQSASAASKFITALEAERANPTGTAAFPSATPILPACGLFGFEFLVGAAALAGLRCASWPRRRLM